MTTINAFTPVVHGKNIYKHFSYKSYTRIPRNDMSPLLSLENKPLTPEGVDICDPRGFI